MPKSHGFSRSIKKDAEQEDVEHEQENVEQESAKQEDAKQEDAKQDPLVPARRLSDGRLVEAEGLVLARRRSDGVLVEAPRGEPGMESLHDQQIRESKPVNVGANTSDGGSAITEG